MKMLRFLLSIASLVALAGGYVASQWFALEGRAPEWTQVVDIAPVVWAALLLLLGGVALWLIPEREKGV